MLRDVEVDDRRADVRIANGVVAEVGTRLRGCDRVIDGRGGALLPGLHDHHVHLAATAAVGTSVDCSPTATPDLDALRGRLARAPGTGWIRGVGYYESVAGPLDRDVLDRAVPDRPVRVQHRSGGLWMLNSRALEVVATALDDTPDVERGPDGRPNGRLWRYDDRLRGALPTEPVDLSLVGDDLDRYGITGVTDATPDLTPDRIALLTDAVTRRDIRAEVTLLGAPDGWLPPHGLRTGPRKLLLRDHDLPSYDELRTTVAACHAGGRAVAVHCVTRESLVLTLAVLDEVGSIVGDRIEHAAVVPAECRSTIHLLGLRVVSQPWFVHDRGDAYLADVDRRDVDLLYPYASLLAEGIPTVASSDSPYGTLDPWAVIAAASDRRSRTGAPVGSSERVAAAQSLRGYLTAADAPGSHPRRVEPGAPADLVLLDAPLQDALTAPSADLVVATFRTGDPRFTS